MERIRRFYIPHEQIDDTITTKMKIKSALLHFHSDKVPDGATEEQQKISQLISRALITMMRNI